MPTAPSILGHSKMTFPMEKGPLSVLTVQDMKGIFSLERGMERENTRLQTGLFLKDVLSMTGLWGSDVTLLLSHCCFNERGMR